MPVTYEIDKGNGIIRTRCSGAVTFPDVVEHFQTLERDADCPRSADVVLDLRELTSLPTNNQLRSVGEGPCVLVGPRNRESENAHGQHDRKHLRASADALYDVAGSHDETPAVIFDPNPCREDGAP